MIYPPRIMCMFSAPVESVSETRIFARSLPEGRQVLVYRMKLSAKKDVAMILPIPVKPGSGEKAVQFVDLARYPDMLSDMERLFDDTPSPATFAAADSFALPGRRLAVEIVGAYEASYVPSFADFKRLDERFRLPSGVQSSVIGWIVKLIARNFATLPGAGLVWLS